MDESGGAPTPRNGETLSDAATLLVHAHLAEYQTITARISRFMSLQAVPWPALVAFLTIVTIAYEKGLFDPAFIALVAWGAAFVAQLAVQTYYFALYEVYNHVRYVENELRPKLAALLGTGSFWGYEGYLKKTGKANNPLLGDLGPAAISIAAIILASALRWKSWAASDFLGLAINGLFLTVTGLTASHVVKVRKDFAEAH